jgi:hypothetical protein
MQFNKPVLTMHQPFREKNPRKRTFSLFVCFGAPELFEADMAPEVSREFRANGPIPCQGGGHPGPWCSDCRFGEVTEPVEIEPKTVGG